MPHLVGQVGCGHRVRRLDRVVLRRDDVGQLLVEPDEVDVRGALRGLAGRVEGQADEGHVGRSVAQHRELGVELAHGLHQLEVELSAREALVPDAHPFSGRHATGVGDTKRSGHAPRLVG